MRHKSTAANVGTVNKSTANAYLAWCQATWYDLCVDCKVVLEDFTENTKICPNCGLVDVEDVLPYPDIYAELDIPGE
jgi:anaerobic ribonucleoside-triphosphate reductase